MARKVSDSQISRSIIADTPTERLEAALNFINKLKEHGKFKKLYDTYYVGVKKALDYNKNGKIYYDFRFDGTVTGRLSCAAYTCNENSMGVSFHTLPRTPENKEDVNIRAMFLPPEGDYFITSDYKTMELRILAHLSQDPRMLEAIRSGKDLHKATASLIYGISIDQITKRQRQIAKAVSFLIVYGGGAWKLSREVNISEDEAQDVIDALKDAYPRIFTWSEDVEAYLRKNTYVKSMFGRRRNLLDIRSPDKKIQSRSVRQAGNFVIQSSASEITSFAALDIINSLEERGLSSTMVATVHDSIEVTSPKKDVIETLSLMKHRMMEYPYLRDSFNFNLSVPLEIDMEVGPAFGVGVEVHFDGYKVTNREEVLNSIAT